MAVYTYRASSELKSAVKGTLTADSPRQARDQLRQRGLKVHEVQPVAAGRPGPGAWLKLAPAWGAPRGHAITESLRELATLLQVGLPMLEALDLTIRQQKGQMLRVMLDLRDQVASGRSLAQVMEDQTCRGRRVFDPVTTAMTRVGEDVGSLGGVLVELADYRERSSEFRGKIGNALIYPGIILTVGCGVAMFLMTVVIPGLIDALIEAGGELPWITRVIRAVSDGLIRGWLPGVVFLVALAAGFRFWAQTVRGRRRWHMFLLRVPLLGSVLCKQAVARIAFVISTLMRSGIPFEDAAYIAGDSTPNAVLREALAACVAAVREGQDIGQALNQTAVFPDAVVQIFILGQESGNLETMLDRLAENYNRQVASATTRLTAVLEPILIVILASVVGVIAFATLLPILE
ncbi:MAG: type II secretion system F family protein, partial [Planctomycetota bacterium]